MKFYNGEEMYFIVVKYKNDDNKYVKFYYKTALTDIISPEEWRESIELLKKDFVAISWERKRGKPWLEMNDYVFIE